MKAKKAPMKTMNKSPRKPNKMPMKTTSPLRKLQMVLTAWVQRKVPGAAKLRKTCQGLPGPAEKLKFLQENVVPQAAAEGSNCVVTRLWDIAKYFDHIVRELLGLTGARAAGCLVWERQPWGPAHRLGSHREGWA